MVLPLIALQYHDVVLKVHLRNFNECYRNNSISTELSGYQISEFKVWADYVFLDMEERILKDMVEKIKNSNAKGATPSISFSLWINNGSSLYERAA